MAVTEEERGGGNVWTCPLPSSLSLPHTLVLSPRARLASHWLNPQLYIYMIGQGGVYILSVGRLNLATSFKTFKQGRQRERDSESGGLSDGGESSFGQTAAPHTPNKNCCLLRKKKKRVKKRKRQSHCGSFSGGISCTTTCLFSLSFSSSPSSQISMLCFGICASNSSNSSLDLSLCHLKHFELQFFSRTLQPNKQRQTFAEFHLD